MKEYTYQWHISCFWSRVVQMHEQHHQDALFSELGTLPIDVLLPINEKHIISYYIILYHDNDKTY